MTQARDVFVSRLEGSAFAALRVVAGAAFAVHGAQKIVGWPAAASMPAPGTQLWFGGLIELGCGALVALGLFTRFAAFLASGTMAVAYIQFHWRLNFADSKWLPSINKGELALIYAFLFLFIAAHGGGALSLDGVRKRGRD